MKRPSFQFYPGDWLNDAALRMVSIGARGLWIEMMCLMHQGSEYGYLKVNGKVILSSNLARMSGATLSETEGWLGELESAGVFSRDESGCIFSRRMIRDEKIRESRAAGGSKGGNPMLLKARQGSEEVENKVNLQPNLRPTPSSSSSSSSSKKDISVPAQRRPKKTALPENFGISDRVRSWAKENGHANLEAHMDAFKRKAVMNSYAYADWDMAFMEAVRENWAKLPAVNGAEYRDARYVN